jgi:hypothetical protein
MIILYVIGIPVVAFLLLRHNKHKLNDLAVKQKYGFLYSVRHAMLALVALAMALQFIFVSFHSVYAAGLSDWRERGRR